MPGRTVTVSPGRARSIAAWMDWPGCTTRLAAAAGSDAATHRARARIGIPFAGRSVSMPAPACPAAAPGDWLHRVAELDAKRVALVGHDPQLSGAVAALANVEPARVDFPKGAIVRFDGVDPKARKAEARWWLEPGEKKPHDGLPVK